MNRTIVMAAAALLLSACASTSTREGMVYRDGSWYSPAAEGRGDYYTGSARTEDAWDHPWAWSVGVTPYGGYCPVRYRYCTSFWADPWSSGYYNPYWYRPWTYHRPQTRRHRSFADVVEDQRDDVDAPVRRERSEAPRPRTWDERPRSAPRARDGGGARARRETPLSGDGSR